MVYPFTATILHFLTGVFFHFITGADIPIDNINGNEIIIDRTLERINKEAFDLIPRKKVFRLFPQMIKGSKSMLILKEPKTKKSKRKAYISDQLKEEIQWMLQRQAKNKLLVDDYTDYGLLFAQQNGSPIEPKLMEKWFKKHLAAIDLELPPDLTFHSLRHTSVSAKMSLSGSDTKTVQKHSGHSTIQSLDRYNHTDDERTMQLANEVAKDLYGDDQQTNMIQLIEVINSNPELLQMAQRALDSRYAQKAKY